MNLYHTPILLNEIVNNLNINKNATIIDMTYGSGAYSKRLLNEFKNIKIIAFDCDEDALQNYVNDERLILFHSDYRYFNNFLEYLNIKEVDAIIADLGVSSHQFDTASRGFSFRFDSSLDLRMNKQKQLTAKDIINKYTQEQLTKLFYEYGELNNADKISQEIIKHRNQHPINTTFQLKNALKKFIVPNKEHKFLSKVFLALRIEVNNELDALKEMLLKSINYLKTGGRICIVTYNSLEDTIVKNFFKSGNFEGKVEKDIKGNPLKINIRQIHKKPITPSEEEIKTNNRARSAKLRIAEKL